MDEDLDKQTLAEISAYAQLGALGLRWIANDRRAEFADKHHLMESYLRKVQFKRNLWLSNPRFRDSLPMDAWWYGYPLIPNPEPSEEQRAQDRELKRLEANELQQYHYLRGKYGDAEP